MAMTLHVYERRADGTEVCLIPKHTVPEPGNGDRALPLNPMRYPPCACPRHREQQKDTAL